MCKGCRSETLNKSIIPIIAYKLVLTFMFSLWCGGQQERMVMPVERLKSNVVQQHVSIVLQRERNTHMSKYIKGYST